MDREARQTVAQHSKSLRYVVLFLALWTLSTPSASGQTTLKLATLVPTGSIWDKSLKQMGEEFKQATGGRFEITVYSGGTQGDEPTVLRKMRLDALQAGAFTNTGLGMIDPSALGFAPSVGTLARASKGTCVFSRSLDGRARPDSPCTDRRPRLRATCRASPLLFDVLRALSVRPLRPLRQRGGPSA